MLTFLDIFMNDENIQCKNRRKSHTSLCQAICMNEKQPVVQRLSLSFQTFTYFCRHCFGPKHIVKYISRNFKMALNL